MRDGGQRREKLTHPIREGESGRDGIDVKVSARRDGIDVKVSDGIDVKVTIDVKVRAAKNHSTDPRMSPHLISL